MKILKRIKINKLLFGGIILVGFISSLFILGEKVIAQTPNSDEIIVQTMGCMMKSASNAIFEGAYSNNLGKKRVTTYFEYKRNDPDLSVKPKETARYIPSISSPVQNVFYQSPGAVQPFSLYYFRAVSFFNGHEDKKFYGDVLTCDTSLMIVQGNYEPEPISNKSAITGSYSNLTYNSVTLNGLINRDGDEGAKIYFDYDLEQAFIDAENNKDKQEHEYQNYVEVDLDTAKQSGAGLTVSVSLDKLSPATTYRYRIAMVGSDGEEIDGADKNFTTKQVHELSVIKGEPSPPPAPDVIPSSSKSGNLIPCGTSGTPECGGEKGWSQLITLVNNVVKFILFDLVIPIAAIMFAYAGFEMLTSGGNTSSRDKAKKIFVNVAIGLIIAVAAWLIIETILTLFGYDGSWIGF